MEISEIADTIEQLQGEFEDLGVRGLRSAGPKHLGRLNAMREEFERIGAGHLAGRIAAVVTAIQDDDRRAAAALMRALASLRVFERILSLEVAGAALQDVLANDEGQEEDEEDPS